MRKITKGTIPPVLKENGAAWTATYLEYVNRNEEPPDAVTNKYKHPKVKGALVEETHGKCAYCEARIVAIYPGDVEHVLAKKHRPDLIFTWENLTLACQICNTHKSDYHSIDEPLVHPHDDEPRQHLTFLGPTCVNAPGDLKGRRTLLLLQLNRMPLVEKRHEKAREIAELLDSLAQTKEPMMRQILKKQVLLKAADSEEFSSMVKTILEGPEYTALLNGGCSSVVVVADPQPTHAVDAAPTTPSA